MRTAAHAMRWHSGAVHEGACHTSLEPCAVRIAPSRTRSDTVPMQDGLNLVFGASGYVGTNLVARLLRDGPAGARRGTQPQGARGARVGRRRPGRGRCARPGHAAGRAGRVSAWPTTWCTRWRPGATSAASTLAAARAFAAAAAAAGVARIVYLGGLVPPDADSEHLVSRRETGEVLRAGPVPVTELRAGIIVGAGSAAYEVIRDLVNHLPLMVTPRWVNSKSVADRARQPARVPGAPAADRRGRGRHLRSRRAGVHVLRVR